MTWFTSDSQGRASYVFTSTSSRRGPTARISWLICREVNAPLVPSANTTTGRSFPAAASRCTIGRPALT
jgi:hypothetical protein